MKLCRFELREDPGVVRSGVFHDGRFYETDGEQAIGIHDPGALRLLAPIGQPVAIRVFHSFRAMDGSPSLTYAYINPARLQGPNTEIDATGIEGPLDFDVHAVGLVEGATREDDPVEVVRSVLGYAVLLRFFDVQEREALLSAGVDPSPAYETSVLFGPLLVTPDELNEARASDEPTHFRWGVKVKVNDETVYAADYAPEWPFGTLVTFAAAKSPVAAGEVLAWPAMDKPPLELTDLGRGLLPADKLSVSLEPLGTLVGRII
ncbi:MAG: fumarylacetoacetate hydrolase family protein [Armatimonadetes bacterium]|nr:fumarylacetoacetate hydrolase family protein [Armatimonadota bacterium]